MLLVYTGVGKWDWVIYQYNISLGESPGGRWSFLRINMLGGAYDVGEAMLGDMANGCSASGLLLYCFSLLRLFYSFFFIPIFFSVFFSISFPPFANLFFNMVLRLTFIKYSVFQVNMAKDRASKCLPGW